MAWGRLEPDGSHSGLSVTKEPWHEVCDSEIAGHKEIKSEACVGQMESVGV